MSRKPVEPPRRAWPALKVLFAAAILTWVATTLPLEDRLEWRTADGEVHSVPGDIGGDWKAESARFLPAADAMPDESWPEALHESWASRRPLAVGRDGSGAAGAAYDWKPGIARAFQDLEVGLVALGFLLLLLAVLGGVTRWWRLLVVVGCPTSWWNAVRLSFLGLFFNLVVPGLTGGDAVRAALVVRENPAARAQALVTVFVDRVVGLLVLLVLAAVVVLVAGEAFGEIRPAVLALVAVGVGGAAVYSSRSLRRVLRFEALVHRLPLGQKLAAMDRAVLLYSSHRFELLMAVVLSLWNHVVGIFGVVILGRAVGVSLREVGLGDWFVLVPVANVLASIPIAPGGWGVGEYAYKVLFQMIGASATLGVAVSVVFRLCMAGLSLLGGLFLLAPGSRREVATARHG